MQEQGYILMEDMEGEWCPPPAPNVIPVEEEKYIENIRSSLKRDLPNIKRQKDHDRVMVMVCGGPTAKMHIEEIRKKSNDPNCDIFCSNQTAKWLLDNGILPHTHFIIDPKESKVKDVEVKHPDTRYLIGIGCDPKVFDALKDFNVHRLFAVGGGGKNVGNRVSDLQICNAMYDTSEFTPLEGGSMAGLRAMTLANILGYQTVEFYGFDSCYFDTDENGIPVYYSYEKARAENLMEAQTDNGRVFLTTPVFASQARQYLKWKHRLPWIKFIIHGDSLTAEIDRIDEAKNRPAGYRISEYMMKMNSTLHRDNGGYGNGEDPDIGMATHVGAIAVTAGRMLKEQPEVTILDYGSGKGAFRELFPPIPGVIINEYDPCIKGKDNEPSPADIVVCLDVMEHIEPKCLDDVLMHLRDLTKKICYVAICTSPASKYYSDGQNCHLIVENHEWWTARLRKYFYMVEASKSAKHFNAVLQVRKNG